MQIVVPNAVNYQSPLIAVPSRLLSEPREGRKQVPCEIAWGDMAPDGCMLLNLGNNATLEFSQVIALKVDNSLCGATVTFVFPDTGDTVAVPAYSPNTVIEVFSQQTQFYVVAAGPISGDITRFQILNFLPPPISISVSTEQQTAIVSGISAAAAGNTQIVPAGVNGTLQALEIHFGVANAAADSNADIQILDGNGKLIAQGVAFVKNATSSLTTLVSLQDIAVRFENGLIATVGGLLIASGQFNVNAYYRLP